MLTTREKILVEGEDDSVRLWQVHEYVALDNRDADLATVQQQTLGLVRDMAAAGEIALGDATRTGFVDWDIPLDEAIDRLAADYVARFDDRDTWPWKLWIRVTDKGRAVAREHAADYAAWLNELRDQGRDYEVMPAHLDPNPARLPDKTAGA